MTRPRLKFDWKKLAPLGKQLLFIPPIAMAIVAYLYLVESKEQPKLRTETEQARTLSVIEVEQFDLKAKATGFGTSSYSKKWRAIAQVEGRLVHVHPDLQAGAVIQKDEVLFRVDDGDYVSVVEEMQATIAQTNAEIAKLQQTATNYDKTLSIERQALEVYQTELTRAETLLARNAGSRSSIDTKRQALLAQQQKIQELENSKSLIAPEKASLLATVKQTESNLVQSQRNVQRTKVTAPFSMRIGDVNLQQGQFVSINETLFEGYSIDGVEVEVQLSIKEVGRLISFPDDKTFDPAMIDMKGVRDIFDVDVVVRNTSAGPGAIYPAKFLRTREVLDSQSRTVGLVVGVNSLKEGIPTLGKPPLIEGAFCNVDFFGPKLTNQVIIPQEAIRDSKVYLIDADNRLVTRGVEVAFIQDDYAVIRSGLTAGEKLIVANPAPAIEGMLVKPQLDEDLRERLRSNIGTSSNNKSR